MGSKGRILGRAVVFAVVCGWVARLLSTSVFLSSFFISSSKLLVFVISSSIRSFSSELFSLLSSPQFFCLREATVSGLRVCPRASNQLYSILADGSLSSAFLLIQQTPSVITLIIAFAIIIISAIAHHLQSSALFWPFDTSFFRNALKNQSTVTFAVLQARSDYHGSQNNRKQKCISRSLSAIPEQNSNKIQGCVQITVLARWGKHF